jgi:hypothetical protein
MAIPRAQRWATYEGIYSIPGVVIPGSDKSGEIRKICRHSYMARAAKGFHHGSVQLLSWPLPSGRFELAILHNPVVRIPARNEFIDHTCRFCGENHLVELLKRAFLSAPAESVDAIGTRLYLYRAIVEVIEIEREELHPYVYVCFDIS